jgi:hypothetical protein
MARLVTRGCTGLDVKELQAALNFHVRGPATPLATDGIFGPLTDARLRQFQRLAKVADDGDAGPITVGSLYRTLLVSVEADIIPRQSAAGRQSFAPGGSSVPEGPEPPPRVPVPRLPPRPHATQVRRAFGEGFELETKLTFNPLAKPGVGERTKFSFKLALPWPAFLPKPLKLEVESSPPGADKFELDAKVKAPFEIKIGQRVELTPYFYAGAGMSQNHFKDLNAGAGASLKFRMLRNIFGTGLGLSLEADGGAKFMYDHSSGKFEAKRYLDLMMLLDLQFDLPIRRRPR